MRENLAELLGSQKLWSRVPKVLSAELVNRLLDVPAPGDPLLAARSGPAWSCSTPPAAGRRRFRI